MRQCTLALLLLVLCTALFFTLPTAQAQSVNNSSQIELRRGLLTSNRYTYQGSEPQKIFNGSGLKFQPHFEEVLGQDPAALQEAQKAFAYNGVALAGEVLMVVGSAMLLLEAIDEAQAISSGDLRSKDRPGLEVALVGVLVAGVATLMGNQRMENGVRIFNEHQQQISQAPQSQKVHFALGGRLLESRPALTMRLHFQ